jgi:hypothetical protein
MTESARGITDKGVIVLVIGAGDDGSGLAAVNRPAI